MAEAEILIVEPSEELEALMERAQVNHAQKITFRTDPPRGIRLLEYALGRPKIRNPAAFALARFRAELADAHEQRVGENQVELQAVPDPLDVAEIERGLAFARAMRLPPDVIATIEAELDAARRG
jgi:hypothetical protein